MEEMGQEDDPDKLFDICNKMVKWRDWTNRNPSKKDLENGRDFFGNQKLGEMKNNEIKIRGDDDRVLTLSSRYNKNHSKLEGKYGIPYITRAGESTR